MLTENGLKRCPKCGELKEVALHFYKASKRPDGYEPWCKACHAAKYRHRFEANPELVRRQSRENMRRQRAAHPEKFAARWDARNEQTKAARKQARLEKLGDVEAGFRRCADCKQIKPLDQFAKDRRRAGGVGSYCLECNKVRSARRTARYLEGRREEVNQRNRDRRSTSEFREWEAEYRKRPHVRLVRAQRDKVNAHKKRGKGDLSRHDWAAILDAFGHRCCYCDAEGKMTIDHLTPIKQRGTNAIGNIAPACQRCNASKRARTAEEFCPARAAEIRRRALLCEETLLAA